MPHDGAGDPDRRRTARPADSGRSPPRSAGRSPGENSTGSGRAVQPPGGPAAGDHSSATRAPSVPRTRRDQRLGQLVAHPQLDSGVEGLHAAGGPLVVDGVAGRVQRRCSTATASARPRGDGDERGEPAAAGRRRRPGPSPGTRLRACRVARAVVAGPAAGRRARRPAASRGRRRAAAPAAGPRGAARAARRAHRATSGSRRWARRARRSTSRAEGAALRASAVERLAEQVVAVGEGAGRRGTSRLVPPGGRRAASSGCSGPRRRRGAASRAGRSSAAEHGRVDACAAVRAAAASGSVVGRPVHQGLPPAPTRVMISQSARSSKIRAVGIRTVVLRRPVTGWPARLVQ